MPEPSITLHDAGGDLAIANAAQRARGEPESKLRWVCQHSCPEETIPDCTDLNCEGTLALDDSDARLVRTLAEQGDLAPFDAVTLTTRIAGSARLVTALLDAGAGLVRVPGQSPAPATIDLRGSLLAFARCCARIVAEPEGVPGRRDLARLVAEKLRARYRNGARALLDQRFVERRTAPGREAPLVVFAALGDWPGIAYVAFGTDKDGSTTGYDVAYGLTNTAKGVWRFARVSPGASREPGEYYGPNCRLVVRADRALQAKARGIAERFAAAPDQKDGAAATLDCFAAIARALALDLASRPIPPAKPGNSPYLRPTRFVRALLDRIPL